VPGYPHECPKAGIPLRLRVAVMASNEAAQHRLAMLVAQCGHQLVDVAASPDAVLTDGAADGILPAATVAVCAFDGAFAGRLPPEASAAQVDAALRAVATGLTVRAATPNARNFDPLPEEPAVLLTPREIEVLSALVDGRTNKETARLLGISPHTVKFHIESLFRKLGVASRAEAVAKGMRQQIVEF
jgi:two-component system, NarL family, nitrate/nitrite response regulator NarL